MGLQLYNSLTRHVEAFQPISPPRVSFYMCGPTVWNYAHIGNFRTFLLGDLLNRYLTYSGYDVVMMMNLTDVDDRTIQSAAKNGSQLREHTEPFVTAFFEDRDYLRIRPADVYPRATEYVGPMVELVERLLERGLAYVGDDGSVYYAVAAFATYGRLSQIERRELRSGARVASDEYSKDDVRDFAVWKAATAVDEQVGAAWDAPFGRGRPGWHLECSAMVLGEVKARLGVETVDLHAGGADLVFPHHENEIAQSEGATGQPFARCWLHGEFLSIHGTKMSKRFGNFLTVRDLREEGVDPAAVRMLMFTTHYRQQLNFTDEALVAAREGVRRLGDFRDRLLAASEQGANPVAPREATEFEQEFGRALDDDLGAPEAMAAVFTFVRAANRALDEDEWRPDVAAGALEVLDRVNAVLDVYPAVMEADAELSAWVETQIHEREAARGARDWARADAIRDKLGAKGIELEDTPEGTRWRVGDRGAGGG